jgi:hypothetical protein
MQQQYDERQPQDLPLEKTWHRIDSIHSAGDPNFAETLQKMMLLIDEKLHQ